MNKIERDIIDKYCNMILNPDVDASEKYYNFEIKRWGVPAGIVFDYVQEKLNEMVRVLVENGALKEDN